MTIKKRPVSPRQKMINLMYVVLMAMLALNVSTEVLDGFTLIERSLNRTTHNASLENDFIYSTFDKMMQLNPEKTGIWHEKALVVQRLSDSLYTFAGDIKKEIIREADGSKANTATLVHKEDLEAANQVLLSPVTGKGQQLYEAINNYRESLLSMLTDSVKREVVAENFSTEVPASSDGKNWQEYMFESMPAVAAVTLLTKLQSDIRYAEGEVLHTLLEKVDERDTRVNSLQAFVIPNAQTIVRGNRLRANIVMAAVDTTSIPDIYIGGNRVELEDGVYDKVCTQPGNFVLSGWMETKTKNGEILRRDFSQDYTVVEPSATVSADLMNVLYAGYDNPLSISVPGVSQSSVSASIEGGTLTQTSAGHYTARPSRPGLDVVITVFSNSTGSRQQMAQHTFKVRRLPEPSPFIDLTDDSGQPNRYKGGRVSKAQLFNAGKIGAAVDDGILHIPFLVNSFEMVFFDNMGNAMPMVSDGAMLSANQKDLIKKLSRGRRFYISKVSATGPDGTERLLSSTMELIIK